MWSSPSRSRPVAAISARKPSRRLPRGAELDAVALAVVEADRLDALEALQRPGEAEVESCPPENSTSAASSS